MSRLLATGFTPGRQTVIELDGPISNKVRDDFRIARGAGDVGRPQGYLLNLTPRVVSPNDTANVTMWPGGVMGLTPLSGEVFNMLTAPFPGAIINPSQLITAPNFRAAPQFRGFSDLPGTTPPGGLASSAWGWKRQKPEGQDWGHADNVLGADMLAVPPPTPAADLITLLPATRVAITEESFEENCGFGLIIDTPHDEFASSVLCRFYFGGSAPTDPPSSFSGNYCLELRGSGKAILYEQDAAISGDIVLANYVERFRFLWAEPMDISGGKRTIWIIPQATDRIVFQVQAQKDLSFTAIGHAFKFGTATAHGNTTLYTDTPQITGRKRIAYMTGRGPFRLDVMQALRHTVTPCVLVYPQTGLCVDGLFNFPPNCDRAVPILSTVKQYARGPSCHVGWQFLDGATGNALPVDGLGNPLPPASLRAYAEFAFYSSTDTQRQSPLLFDWSARQLGAVQVTTDPPVTSVDDQGRSAVKIQEVSIVGDGLDPSLPNSACVVRDPLNKFAIVRGRDEIPYEIRVYTSEDPRGYVTIFQGETMHPTGQWMTAVNPNWWDYVGFRGLGRWHRVYQAVVDQLVDYRSSSLVGPPAFDPHTGYELPPKITAIIYDLFHRAGVPPDELDIPITVNDLTLRPSGRADQEDDYQLQVGRKGGYWAQIGKLARYILARFIVRDGNVGARGMWRLRTPPDPAAGYPNVLADFYVRRQSGYEGRSIYPLGAMGDDHTTWVRSKSYCEWTLGPEGNYVAVSAVGNVAAWTGKRQKLTNYMLDLSSADLLPGVQSSFKVYPDTHPRAGQPNENYLGYQKKILVNAPDLVDQLSVDFLCRNIFALTRGQNRFIFQAPLLFVTDLLDPLLAAEGRKRPLRVYDTIRIHDQDANVRKALVWDCSPHYRFDGAQTALYQGMFVS